VEGELLLTGVEGAGRFLSLILKVQQAAGLVVMTKPKSHTQDHTSSKLRERRGDTALEHSPSHKQPAVHTNTHISLPHAHTDTPTHEHTSTPTHTHADTHTHLHTLIHTQTHTHADTHTHTHTFTDSHTHA